MKFPRHKMTDIEQRIKDGYRLNYDQAMELAQNTPLEELCAMANRLREHFQGRSYEVCSIMNARSGRCSEDCKWCSQSAHHKAQVDIYPLVGEREAVALARENASRGVKRFSLVTSGRTMTDREIDKVCALYDAIRAKVDIHLCASMGLLTEEQMKRLRASGVTRYHCNLETAPSFFPSLCSTHTTQDKLRTLQAAREAGMELCSGGIIGMGESRSQRIELAVALRDAGADSVPLNILNPISGTPLEGTEPLPDDEILLTAAMMRIINPAVHLRLAGGRIRIGHLTERLLECGVSSAIVGDMLTTVGSNVESDIGMFEGAGYVAQ